MNEEDRREYIIDGVIVRFDVGDTWVLVTNSLGDSIEIDVSELDELVKVLQEARPLLRNR